KPVANALGDDFADVFGSGEFFDGGFLEFVELHKAAREILGNANADMEDAQAKDEAPEVTRFAGLNSVEKVLGGFFAHAFEAGQLCEGQFVEIGHVANETGFDELGDEDFAAAFDI